MCVILAGSQWYAGVKIGKHRCVCLFVPFRGETHERCCRSILRARTKLVRMQLVCRFENGSLACVFGIRRGENDRGGRQ